MLHICLLVTCFYILWPSFLLSFAWHVQPHLLFHAKEFIWLFTWQVPILGVYVFLHGQIYLILSGLDKALLVARAENVQSLETALASESFIQLGLLTGEKKNRHSWSYVKTCSYCIPFCIVMALLNKEATWCRKAPTHHVWGLERLHYKGFIISCFALHFASGCFLFSNPVPGSPSNGTA